MIEISGNIRPDKPDREVRDGYLICAVHEDYEKYKDEMLGNNLISGLLPVHIQDFNERHEYWFDVSGMESLKKYYLRCKPDVEMISSLVGQLEEIDKRLGEYLLEPEDLLIDPEYIFVRDGQLRFAYQPGYGIPVQKQTEKLLEEIMECMDYENRAAVSLIYLLHGRIRQGTGLSLKGLCEEILHETISREESCDGEEPERPGATVSRDKVCESMIKEETITYPKKRKTKRSIAEVIKNLFGTWFSGRPDDAEEFDDEDLAEENFADGIGYSDKKDEKTDMIGDTVYLRHGNSDSGDNVRGDDTVLLTPQKWGYVLEPVEDTRDPIPVFSFPFCIGKKEVLCGYRFHDAVISRQHARLTRRGSDIFLTDCGSLNGTALNGKRMEPEKEYKIVPGDIIGFAEINFIFTCLKPPDDV